jgi:hypothetical protein
MGLLNHMEPQLRGTCPESLDKVSLQVTPK